MASNPIESAPPDTATSTRSPGRTISWRSIVRRTSPTNVASRCCTALEVWQGPQPLTTAGTVPICAAGGSRRHRGRRPERGDRVPPCWISPKTAVGWRGMSSSSCAAGRVRPLALHQAVQAVAPASSRCTQARCLCHQFQLGFSGSVQRRWSATGACPERAEGGALWRLIPGRLRDLRLSTGNRV